MSKIEPGCLAMVRKSNLQNDGKIVTCIRVLPTREAEKAWWFSSDTDPLWEVDPPLRSTSGKDFHQRVKMVPYCNQSRLRRIDNPGDDEADLLLAPLPKQDEVPA